MIDIDRLAPMFHAAKPLGRLVARGLMARSEAEDLLIAWAAVAGARGDIRGTVTRLRWAVRDAVAGWDRTDRSTEWQITRAVAPLLAQGARSSALLAAAAAANRRARHPLPEERVRAVVRTEVAMAVRRGAFARV